MNKRGRQEETKEGTEGQRQIQTKTTRTHITLTMAVGDDDEGKSVYVFNLIPLRVLAFRQNLVNIWVWMEISLKSKHFHPKYSGLDVGYICVCMCERGNWGVLKSLHYVVCKYV